MVTAGQPYPLNDAAETVNEIGSSIRRVMGGTSGIINNIFCKAAYAQLKADSHSVIAPLQWADALEAAIAAVSKYGGASAVSKYGGASAGYRTLLDALIPVSSVLKEHLVAGDDPIDAFMFSSEAALAGAESTKHMQAQVAVLHMSRETFLHRFQTQVRWLQLHGIELQPWL